MFTSKSNFEKITKTHTDRLSVGRYDEVHELDEHIKSTKDRRSASAARARGRREDRNAVRNGKRSGWEV